MSETISRSSQDSRYPKARLVGWGCVTLAHNKADEKQIDRQNFISMLIGVVFGVVALIVGICWLVSI